ncbi:MAG: F0F1 ATP synthase subunit gamma [Alphaproteobacteria bacterium]
MPSLRDYRDRITSVKSTRKITSAMKMVAASKLKKAQDQAEASQPYATAMADMLARVAANVVISDASSKLLAGTGSAQKHLLVVVSADRGLCGGFNGNISRAAKAKADALIAEGKEVQFVCVGRKAADVLKRDFAPQIIKKFVGIMGSAKIEYAQANEVTSFILEQFEAGAFDVCSLVYNEFVSVLTQKPQAQQIIPFKLPEVQEDEADEAQDDVLSSPYSFEPEEEEILDALLPRNLGVQVFRALLDSAAGEQAARMTAMDNATRNAGDMINDLTLQYNRARQAFITKELIEIISGAEAV